MAKYRFEETPWYIDGLPSQVLLVGVGLAVAYSVVVPLTVIGFASITRMVLVPLVWAGMIWILVAVICVGKFIIHPSVRTRRIYPDEETGDFYGEHT